MKSFITFLFILFLNSAWANNYYFSTVSGDDSRTPSQAQNPATPWKTLNKLNSYFGRLKAGDNVLLKRGETFYGYIRISKSGTPGSPIVIGAYGSGSRPVITSLVSLNNWVFKGSGIWESYNPGLSTSVNTVILNGVEQQLGRYPNSDAPGKGYLNFESHKGKSSITDNELSPAINWKGAEVVIRCNRWIMDRNLITSHIGHTINYKPGSNYSPSDNFGYFIQNDIKTLDKFGEWYYNSSTKKLSAYFGNNNPSSYTVQATSINNLVTSIKYSNIVFDNLTIKGANSCGLFIREGSNIRISNSDVMFSGYNGIAAYYHAKLTIENCNISDSHNDGIDLGYGANPATIRNNKISNSSIFAGMGGNGDGKGMAIHSNGNNTLIEYNEITNTGYTAINFNGDYTVIKNNYIDSFCMIKDDGGAIYTYTGASNATRYGRKITGNIVLNGKGAAEGTFPEASSAEGIYLDDNSSGVEITNNTVANLAGRGIFLNNARNLVIRNNTIYNNQKQFFASQYRKVKGAAIRNLTVKGNIFFSKDNTQKTAHFTTEQNDNNLIGTLDSNYYERPIDDRLVILNSYINNSGVRVNENLDLEGWKKKYNKDQASKKAAREIAPYRLNTLKSSNKFANGTFTTSMRGVFPSSCRVALKSSGQLDGGHLEINPTNQTSSVFVNVGELKAGVKYILRYTAKGSANEPRYLGASLRKQRTPYTTLTPIQYRKVGPSASDNEMIFSSNTNEAEAQIVFSASDESTYYLDNVQLYEAEASITNIDDSIRFVYNPGRVAKTVSLDGSYVDVKNTNFSNSIMLQPFQSAILIKATKIQNTATKSLPVVAITSPTVNAEFKASATIKIDAEASAKDGSIKKVELYNGTVLLATTTGAPYTYTWKNVPAGSYTLTAKATSNDGSVATSKSVAISVNAPAEAAKNKAPEVNIVSPQTNAAYNTSADINMLADASDADGTIKKVEFYNGTTLLHTEFYSPYTYSWNNVPAGNYTITAKATDNNGSVTTSKSVRVQVSAPAARVNAAPKVKITSPKANKNYKAYSAITISAEATDEDGRITKVEFYNGTKLIHTETGRPYTWDWKYAAPGTYTITAVAIDNEGAATKSASVTISVTSKNVSQRFVEDSDTTLATNDNETTANIDTTVTKKASAKTNSVYAVALERTGAMVAGPKTYSVKVFPNPAVNNIQIKVEGLTANSQKATLLIQNLSGIIIKNTAVILSGKTLQADITSLTSGMYILTVVTDNMKVSQKFIKN